VAESVENRHVLLVGSRKEKQTRNISPTTARDGFSEWVQAARPFELPKVIDGHDLYLLSFESSVRGCMSNGGGIKREAVAAFKADLRVQEEIAMRTVHDFIDDMCRKLGYNGDASAKFKAKIVEFLRARSLLSLSAIVEAVTEPMLIESKLSPMWVYVSELKESAKAVE
jgi:hypothetical protein